MRTASFGASSTQVPLVGQGTWNIEQSRERDAIAALRAGINAGMTHLDTAEMYGSGQAERLIGRAIQGESRDALFLVSKVLPQNASREGTIRACDRTLRRMNTNYLDVYLLHWRGGSRLEETFEAFDRLKADGKIRAYGVSNFDVDDLEEALSIAGPGQITCNQVLYHLKKRSIEHAVIPFCLRHRIAVVAYSPFGSGNFPSLRRGGGKILQAIAERRSVSPYQVTLAFLIQKGGVFTIPKAAELNHVAENAAAADLMLTGSEIEEIDRAFPLGGDRRLPLL